MDGWTADVVTFTYSCACGFTGTQVEYNPEPDAVFVARHYCLQRDT